MNSTAGTHSKSLTVSASIVGTSAVESRVPVMVTSIPGCTDPSESFLPSRSRTRVPKLRVSKWLTLVRTVQVKPAEPHVVRTIMTLPSTETTLALRKSTSPLLAICISSGRRWPLAAAALAVATLSCASAVCGGNENRKAKSEKAKNADPTITAKDLYRFKSIKLMSPLYKECYEALMRFMKWYFIYIPKGLVAPRTSKWRCEPVALPVLPTLQMELPCWTRVPTVVSTWLMCAYRVCVPLSCRITT